MWFFNPDLEDNGKGTDLTASIFKILYATTDGFQPADESENPEEVVVVDEEEQEETLEVAGTAGPEEEAQEDETF